MSKDNTIFQIKTYNRVRFIYGYRDGSYSSGNYIAYKSDSSSYINKISIEYNKVVVSLEELTIILEVKKSLNSLLYKYYI